MLKVKVKLTVMFVKEFLLQTLKFVSIVMHLIHFAMLNHGSIYKQQSLLQIGIQ